MNFLQKSFKALKYLGFRKIWHYTLYRIGLQTGHYRRLTPCEHVDVTGQPGISPYQHFPQVSDEHKALALAEADEICQGRVRLFGGESVPLDLEAGASNQHWSFLERNPPDQDIKFIWEPGRFGWAITLARAFAFSRNPSYAQDFWDKTIQFLAAHPPNLGRQWQSAQEVAIRLMVLVICDRALAQAPSSTPEHRQRLWQAIAEHALRIPPTLVYARAQNNNHLLSEAAGLYTAGVYLPDHPRAAQWRELGWRWLNWGFQHQIDEFGTYTQHSTNYHRLMLQLALFTDHLRREGNHQDWPEATRKRLAAAARWLWALIDPHTGLAPNLGANDGAYLFPLTSLNFEDYRPVVLAAGQAFLDQDSYAEAPLGEMSDWFNLQAPAPMNERQPHAADMPRVSGKHGRAFLHAARYQDRPSHADQLHADLWWRGVNVALDPGTYLYSGEPPWDNALVKGSVHNTLILDGQDQMLRAGRFLWLDWAQADILAHELDQAGNLQRITAEHDGFQSLGARHRRTVTRTSAGWSIRDTIISCGRPERRIHQAQLSWLLPDWTWQITRPDEIKLVGPNFSMQLTIQGGTPLCVFRGGQCLHGEMPPEPTWGWTSPTYSIKRPALMLVSTAEGFLPLEIHSEWQFDEH